MTLLAHRLGDATRLVRSGQLRDATAAIQAALAGAPVPRDATPHVVDLGNVDIRTGRPTILLGHDGAAPFRRAGSAGPDTARSRSSGPQDGTFVRGTYAGPEGTRAYKLFVPRDLAPSPAMLVMLHGCTQDADDFAAGTGMNDVAGARGVLVLYPEQSRAANAQGCWNWFDAAHQRRGQGEPALLAAMTRSVMREHAVDPCRVYVAGLSAGGAMAVVLGEAYPELYAAVGAHSGLPTGAAHDMPSAFAAMKGANVDGLPASGRRLPRRARMQSTRAPGRPSPPTIVFHGDRDLTVHAVNGERIAAGCADTATATCIEHPRRQANGREVTRRVHRRPDGRAVAEHWIVHGATHAWSGGHATGSYADPKGPDASREMLRFFLEHPLQDAP